jgi:hypothetical protein
MSYYEYALDYLEQIKEASKMKIKRKLTTSPAVTGTPVQVGGQTIRPNIPGPEWKPIPLNPSQAQELATKKRIHDRIPGIKERAPARLNQMKRMVLKRNIGRVGLGLGVAGLVGAAAYGDYKHRRKAASIDHEDYRLQRAIEDTSATNRILSGAKKGLGVGAAIGGAGGGLGVGIPAGIAARVLRRMGLIGRGTAIKGVLGVGALGALGGTAYGGTTGASFGVLAGLLRDKKHNEALRARDEYLLGTRS